MEAFTIMRSHLFSPNSFPFQRDPGAFLGNGIGAGPIRQAKLFWVVLAVLARNGTTDISFNFTWNLYFDVILRDFRWNELTSEGQLKNSLTIVQLPHLGGALG